MSDLHEITVRLTPEQIAALEARANLEGIGVSKAAEIAIAGSLSPHSAETQRLVMLSTFGVNVVLGPSLS